jgi:beta-lactamase regulating signal transducer with metallopeptidase domain
MHVTRQTQVSVTTFLSSPCLIGHLRPTILLPEDTQPADYEQVFLHELAHRRRGD